MGGVVAPVSSQFPAANTMPDPSTAVVNPVAVNALVFIPVFPVELGLSVGSPDATAPVYLPKYPVVVLAE